MAKIRSKKKVTKSKWVLIFVVGLIVGFIIGQPYFSEASRDYVNYNEKLLEEIRDNGDEIISKLSQISENTRDCE